MLQSPDNERRPRRRGRLIAATAVAVVVVLAIAIVVVTRPSGKPKVVVGADPSTTTTAPAPDCTVPQLHAVTGPAAAALRGGAAVSTLELDSGQLTVSVPSAAQTPSVSEADAECAALAANEANGGSIGASATGGVAIGYGVVTVAPQLVSAAAAAAKNPGGIELGADPSTSPQLPPPAAYDGRLAWVVVVEDPPIFHCPMMSAPPTSVATAPGPVSNGYVVFLVDAHTGSDTLLYSEGGPAPCGGSVRLKPSVSVPSDEVSVPWKLVSRAADHYAGTISISVLPCDGHPGVASVDRDHPAVQVVVQRPVATSCGAPTWVNIALHAAIVTADLPASIDHDPVGLDIDPFPSESGGPTPGATDGVLHQFDPGTPDAANPLTLHVNDVVFLPDAYTGNSPNLLPATSSDPAVFGLLDGSRNEYRAWKTGRVELTLASTFGSPGAAPQIVHVIVTP